MTKISIQEVEDHIRKLVESTIEDMSFMKNDGKEIQEFYNGMLFGYDEILDYLKHRKEVEELR